VCVFVKERERDFEFMYVFVCACVDLHDGEREKTVCERDK